MNEIFAYRIKNARIMRGISIKKLTEELQVSKQMISKYENGKSIPDSKKLIKLANILNVKPDYFFRPANVSLEDVKFRKKAKAKKSKINSIKANILRKMENYLVIEDILSIKSEFTNPLKNKTVNEPDDVEELAADLRLAWNIGNDPISNVITLLESNEIKVIEIDEPEENNFDGLSTYVNDKFPAVIINKNFSVERKRFTLFHELGHLLLNFNENITEKEEEEICNRFAGAMLLPAQIIYDEIGKKRNKISLNELLNFQKQYGISIQAIMYRLVDLKIIPKNRIRNFYMWMNSSPERKDFINQNRFLGDEKSERYKRLVYKALSQEIISISRASALLDTDVHKIQEKLVIL